VRAEYQQIAKTVDRLKDNIQKLEEQVGKTLATNVEEKVMKLSELYYELKNVSRTSIIATF
jgi:exonuclease VII large subunit